MKNILALIGGGDRDEVVFETALAAAEPCSSHVNFLHIHVGPVEAARGSAVEFATGSALRVPSKTLNTAPRLTHASRQTISATSVRTQ